VALAWLWLWRDAAMMRAMASAGHAAMASPAWRDAGAVFAMWTIMMVGMMVPSAAPAVLAYAAIARRHRAQGSVLPAAWTFAAGYVAVWTAFSAVATLLQLVLQRADLTTSMLEPASRPLSAVLLVVAGLFQWAPVKQACLSRCRTPIEFFVTAWRGGPLGPFRMGAAHGRYCVGCCWALMLLLFVAGVMNLAWVALIAAFVLFEKVVAAGTWTSRIAGAAMILTGAALVVA
jgi:predicted metal-binding membrane protein